MVCVSLRRCHEEAEGNHRYLSWLRGLVLDYVQWGLDILRQKGHPDWNIEWFFREDLNEGVVIFNQKTIYIYCLEEQPDYPLLLHEITHVIVGRGDHDSEFAHQNMCLVGEYFGTIRGDCQVL